MKTQLIVILLTVSCTSVTQAAEHPTWTTLTKLLGQPIDSKVVTDFVRSHGLREASKGPSGSFSHPDQSYRLMYRGSRIDSIILQASPFPKGYGDANWRPYNGKLPAGLMPNESRDSVLKKLGQPIESRKSTWKRDGLFLWVHFDEKQQLSEVWLSPAVIEAKATL